jgi:hypothetical protein
VTGQDITRSNPESWIKKREAFEKYRRLSFLQEFVNGFVGKHFSKVYCQHLIDHYLIIKNNRLDFKWDTLVG